MKAEKKQSQFKAKQTCPERSRMEPIFSSSIRSSAYCENEFEKTKPKPAFARKSEARSSKSEMT